MADTLILKPVRREANDITEQTLRIIRDYNKSSAFTDRKLTDTPTDDLSVVNRKYVNLNGVSTPGSPVTGQFFFSSVLSQPMWFNGTDWVNSVASIIS